MRRSRLLLAAVILAGLAWLVSCGSSSGPGTTAGSSKWGELIWGQDTWSD